MRRARNCSNLGKTLANYPFYAVRKKFEMGGKENVRRIPQPTKLVPAVGSGRLRRWHP